MEKLIKTYKKSIVGGSKAPIHIKFVILVNLWLVCLNEKSMCERKDSHL